MKEIITIEPIIILPYKSRGLGQAEPEPSREWRLWPGLKFHKAKAASSQAKAAAFRPSRAVHSPIHAFSFTVNHTRAPPHSPAHLRPLPIVFESHRPFSGLNTPLHPVHAFWDTQTRFQLLQHRSTCLRHLPTVFEHNNTFLKSRDCFRVLSFTFNSFSTVFDFLHLF